MDGLTNLDIIFYIIAASIATMITRFLPYILLKKRSDNKTLIFLQKNMGLFIIIILLIYALKSTNLLKFPYGFNEIFSLILALLLQIKTKNALLSIVLPTIVYMLLIKIFY